LDIRFAFGYMLGELDLLELLLLEKKVVLVIYEVVYVG